MYHLQRIKWLSAITLCYITSHGTLMLMSFDVQFFIYSQCANLQFEVHQTHHIQNVWNKTFCLYSNLAPVSCYQYTCIFTRILLYTQPAINLRQLFTTQPIIVKRFPEKDKYPLTTYFLYFEYYSTAQYTDTTLVSSSLLSFHTHLVQIPHEDMLVPPL